MGGNEPDDDMDAPPVDDDGDGAWVTCELAQLLATDPPDPTFVVVLRACSGEGAFPIHIGGFEWQSIHQPLHGIKPPRPMTHDLLLGCLAGLGACLVEVRVRELVDDGSGNGTFFGSLVLRRGGERLQVDCRPSDGLALAVRAGCPIRVSRDVWRTLTGGDLED